MPAENDNIPHFEPPPRKIPTEYRWWSWNETVNKWSKSCWKSDDMLGAITKYYTPHACELSHYHAKLVRYDGEYYDDILTIPKNDLKSFTDHKLREELARGKGIEDAKH